MSIVAPLALLLLIPVAAAILLFRNSGPLGSSGLPGDWERLIDAPLRRRLALGLAGRDRTRIWLALAAAAFLILALARPVLERDGAPDYANLAGRVLVIEMAPGVDPAPQRRIAERLIDAWPDMPTAIVAVAGAGFDVAPLTTDRAHLLRYLKALAPHLMPERGRRPGAGVVHAEALLARAGVIAGQIVLLPALAPAGPRPGGGGGALRAVIVPDALRDDWGNEAAAWGAALVEEGDVTPVLTALKDACRDARLSAAPGSALDLRSWLTGAAALCWLGLFRRRSAA
ncbi:MAG: hypothetical protein WD969_06525 [Paracoccaceae bacterium]